MEPPRFVWSPGRPVSLVERDGRLTIRLLSPTGERMATHVRPFRLADAFVRPFFSRRGPKR